jgi:hypothetical protein
MFVLSIIYGMVFSFGFAVQYGTVDRPSHFVTLGGPFVTMLFFDGLDKMVVTTRKRFPRSTLLA